jgi:hypothetical protein
MAPGRRPAFAQDCAQLRRPRAMAQPIAAPMQRPLVAAYTGRGQDVGKRWALAHRAVGGLLLALLARRDLLDEINDAPPQLGVADPHEGLGECQTVRGGEKVGDISRRGCFSHSFRPPCARDVRRTIEKERDRHLQYLRDLLKSAGTNAIGALLILLNLLKGEAERVAQLLLTHAQHHPAHAHPAADVLVDRIWGFFCYHTRPQPTPTFLIPITLSYGIAINRDE